MNIKNTNIKLRDGAYILEYSTSGTSDGPRITIITYNLKKTVTKYKKAGYHLFGCSLLFSNNVFFKLTKAFKVCTRNRREIIIGNAMYHIQRAADSSKLQTEF
jgi:hypothetical protein